jgi:hypothetical protein
MDQLTSAVVDNEKYVEYSKPERLNGAAVAGLDFVAASGQELQPAREVVPS